MIGGEGACEMGEEVEFGFSKNLDGNVAIELDGNDTRKEFGAKEGYGFGRGLLVFCYKRPLRVFGEESLDFGGGEADEGDGGIPGKCAVKMASGDGARGKGSANGLKGVECGGGFGHGGKRVEDEVENGVFRIGLGGLRDGLVSRADGRCKLLDARDDFRVWRCSVSGHGDDLLAEDAPGVVVAFEVEASDGETAIVAEDVLGNWRRPIGGAGICPDIEFLAAIDALGENGVDASVGEALEELGGKRVGGLEF